MFKGTDGDHENCQDLHREATPEEGQLDKLFRLTLDLSDGFQSSRHSVTQQTLAECRHHARVCGGAMDTTMDMAQFPDVQATRRQIRGPGKAMGSLHTCVSLILTSRQLEPVPSLLVSWWNLHAMLKYPITIQPAPATCPSRYSSAL